MPRGSMNPGPSTVGDFRKTVAAVGTAEALTTSSIPCLSVDVTAETDNTGIITVGGSTVVGALATRRGTPLSAGDTWSAELVDLKDVFIDTTVNGDGVTVSYVAS